MAIKYAVATGDWSSPSTWNGGTLPEPGDSVHAGGFTVVIDQDIDVERISVQANSPAPANGSFVINSIPAEGRSLACSIYAGSVTCLTITANGEIFDIRYAIGGRSTSTYAIMLFTGISITLHIDVVEGGPATNQGNCINSQANVTLVLHSDDIIAGGGTAAGVSAWSPGCNTTIVANRVISRSGSYALRLGGYAHVTADEVYGGLGVGILFTASPNAASVLDLGMCVAGRGGAAVNTTALDVRVLGPLVYADNGRDPLAVTHYMVKEGFKGIKINDDANGVVSGEPVVLTSAASDFPEPEDVRSGVEFGGSLVGTMEIPQPTDVFYGVPVDGEVGQMRIIASEMKSTLSKQIEVAAE